MFCMDSLKDKSVSPCTFLHIYKRYLWALLETRDPPHLSINSDFYTHNNYSFIHTFMNHSYCCETSVGGIWNLNISFIYKAIILIFDPTNWRTSRTTSRFYPKRSSYTKFHKKQKDQKGRYTLAHFWGNWKKVWNEVTGTEKRRF